jgi:hypothetical protein
LNLCWTLPPAVPTTAARADLNTAAYAVR